MKLTRSQVFGILTAVSGVLAAITAEPFEVQTITICPPNWKGPLTAIFTLLAGIFHGIQHFLPQLEAIWPSSSSSPSTPAPEQPTPPANPTTSP